MNETPKRNRRGTLWVLMAISAALIVGGATANIVGRLDRQRQIEQMEQQIELLKSQVEALKDRSGKSGPNQQHTVR